MLKLPRIDVFSANSRRLRCFAHFLHEMTHPFDTFFLLALGQKLPDVKATAADEAEVCPSPLPTPLPPQEVLPPLEEVAHN